MVSGARVAPDNDQRDKLQNPSRPSCQESNDLSRDPRAVKNSGYTEPVAGGVAMGGS